MMRRDLGWALVSAGGILLAVQVVGYTSQAGAALLALLVGAGLYAVFGAEYRNRQ